MTPLRRCGVLALALVAITPGLGRSQTPTAFVEADVTAGFSTESNTSAVATQLRTLGETKGALRFSAEGTWADRSVSTTDAFGAAYPYGGRFQVSEAYVERSFTSRRTAIVRAGQYRSPFGISSRSDFAYAGFSRAPLVRYDGYWSVTNSFLERGIDVVAGSSHLSVEASVGTPGDIGILRRRSGASGTVRAQGYLKGVTVGVSHITSNPYAPETIAPGRLRMSGVDGRWMLGGVQARGEWMVGRPWDGPSTRGGYVDLFVHRPFMGPVTVVARTERLTYESPVPFLIGDELHDEWEGYRHTFGGRIRLPRGLSAQVSLVHGGGELAEYSAPTAVDVALTYSIRSR